MGVSWRAPAGVTPARLGVRTARPQAATDVGPPLRRPSGRGARGKGGKRLRAPPRTRAAAARRDASRAKMAQITRRCWGGGVRGSVARVRTGGMLASRREQSKRGRAGASRRLETWMGLSTVQGRPWASAPPSQGSRLTRLPVPAAWEQQQMAEEWSCEQQRQVCCKRD